MPQTTACPAPSWHTDGRPDFREQVRWLTFDAVRGMLLCKSLRTEVDEMLCVIVYVTQVRALTEPGGKVTCASEDREVPLFGRTGTRCAACPDRDGPCRLRWRLWLREVESNTLFAHTLSVTASANFERYADALQEQGHLPPEVVTNVFAEEFRRRRTGLTFRRLQFARAFGDDE